MSKNIRSKVVRESLLDYNTLANSLKENTESAVKALLGEAVRDTYAKLLTEEEDDKDYEEGEVEDTGSDIANDAESSDVATDDDDDATADTEMDTDGDETIDDDETLDDEIPGDDGLEASEEDLADDGADTDGEGGDEWAEFDKYKVSDDEYDFTDAEDEEIVKVYKLMKNDDQILVHKDDNGNVNIQDNETGAEYLINLGDSGEATGVAASEPSDDEVLTDDEGADDFGAEDDFNNDMDDMNESTERMFELVLEYDSNVGYTDNYQKKDVMTNPGMSEPGKNVNDWDAGVPKGDSKPWSGYPGKKNKADKPFNAGKGKQLEEEDENLEESAAEMGAKRGAHGRMPGTKSHNSSTGGYPYQQHHVSVAGEYKGDDPTGENVKEGFMRRANKVLRENKELKSTLTDLMEQLKKVSVTNHNLAQIIKLVSENTTSQDEKKEIINRFKNEGKTVESSKALYETISRELKKANKMNITEGKSLTVEGSSKINETPIYKSQDMLDSLDLMHRMMK
jgi:hypothetical protein